MTSPAPSPNVLKRRLSTVPSASGSAPKRARSVTSNSTHPLRQTSFPLPGSPPSRSPSLASTALSKKTGKKRAAAAAAADDSGSESSTDGEVDVGDAVLLNTGAAAESSADLDRHKLSLLIDSLSPELYERYTLYLRSTLSKGAVRKLANSVLNQSTTPLVVTTIAGFAKIFVVDMVERAREVQAEWGWTGPLGPEEVREAYRRWLREGEGVGGAVERARGGGRGLFSR
jgi:transcription initiation factor TFIID subunit 11